ncbi:E3 SUMO-protein ligase PIAS1 [Bombina bombina]|uniref:E3 SUMO-protein ligase PIAS1 n=1 Tax=Bombina bombina TaxID=8345 RepID=UPI00235AAB74|nr:E3 SUMO-protein ligase PIAS1 [Bombina bombina]
MPHQASPISRTPSLPAVDSTYINTPLIQDYRHPFHMPPMPYDLQGLDFFPFLSGDNQHYNTSLLAAAAAAASEEPDLLHSSRFFPYTTSSQLFLDQLNTGTSVSLPATNGSNSGSNSSLVSSNGLRESHSATSRGPADSSSLYGIIPDVISLD